RRAGGSVRSAGSLNASPPGRGGRAAKRSGRRGFCNPRFPDPLRLAALGTSPGGRGVRSAGSLNASPPGRGGRAAKRSGRRGFCPRDLPDPLRLAALGTSPEGRGVSAARIGTVRRPFVAPSLRRFVAVSVDPLRLAALGTSPGGRGVRSVGGGVPDTG